MQGYDVEQAVAYMLPRLDRREFKQIAHKAEALIREAIALDFQYMRNAGVLNPDGLMGNAYYDDDDAFEFLLEEMRKTCKECRFEFGPLAAFIEQYMDLQQQYLENSGMLDWD